MVRPVLPLVILLSHLVTPLFAEATVPVDERLVRTLQYRFKLLQAGQVEDRKVAVDATRDLPFLFTLMELERNLALLATPSPEASGAMDAVGLTRSEAKRALELRAGILVGEKRRIWADLLRPAGGDTDERRHKDLFMKEEDLADLYRKVSRKLEREIKRLQREIAREEGFGTPDEQEVAERRAELDALLEQRKSLFLPIFGHELGDGFETSGPLSPASAETLRVAMKTKREALLKALREADGNEGEKERKSGIVGGSYLYSANLGVILDVSGSTKSFIQPLKQEISRSFDRPHYREVVGCKLAVPSFSLTWRATGTMQAIEELVVVHQVDTVYWLSDLRDGYSYAALRRLRHLLNHGNTAFHVKTVGDDPDRVLKPLITDLQN